MGLRLTLEFFGVAPGMTVVDTLPGEVWYTGILLDYLGPWGEVIGVDHSTEMWKLCGEFSPDPTETARWPTEQYSVWRLPPGLATSENDPALRAQMTASGESDRMTLKFRKKS
ncbi:MAG: hypothetical protein O9284_15635 [Steroidobacteraceae bacterium]|jgi:predicted methyltransferase|nr:hypothetical protein [Steroidobacteraceae bacterium]